MTMMGCVIPSHNHAPLPILQMVTILQPMNFRFRENIFSKMQYEPPDQVEFPSNITLLAIDFFVTHLN